MHLRGALIIAGNEAEQDFRQKSALLRAEAAHNPEVHSNKPAFVIDEQIARMHVGVEKAVAQRVAQEALDHLVAERRQVVTLGFERGAVVERRAVDPLHRQHVARGAVPVDGGNAEAFVLGGVLGHLGQRGGLETEIHFHRNRPRQRHDRFDRAQALRFKRKVFRHLRSVQEGVEIDLETAVDAGTDDFHGDRLAAIGRIDLGLVHLRNRGGGDGGAEAGVDDIHRLVESGDDHGFRLSLRKRRHLVLQAFEIVRDRSADDIRPRRHELAELDVSRSELGQRGGEPA